MVHLSYYSPRTGFTSSARRPPPIFEKKRLMERFEASGKFWLPDVPEKIYWGNLRYEPGNRTHLVLEGALGEIQYGHGVDIAEIQGELYNGAPCVLRNVRAQVETYAFDHDVNRTMVYAEILAVGMTPAVSLDNRFGNLIITFSHLNEWIGPPIDLEYKEGSDHTVSEVRFAPHNLEVELSHAGARFKLWLFCARTMPIAASKGELKFTYEYKLYLTASERMPPEWFLEVATLLRQMLMFLIGSAVYTLELALSVLQEPLSDLCYLYPVVGVPMVVRVEPHYFNTRFVEIKPHLPALARAWFDHAAELEVTRGAISNLLLVDGIAPEAIFLRIAQTLEHFHGIAFPGSSRYVEKRIWKKLVDWLRLNFSGIWPEGPNDERAQVNECWSVIVERLGANTVNLEPNRL